MAGPKRTATIDVAAANTPERLRRNADFVCDGTGDEIEINRAIHRAYTINTGDGSTGQPQGGVVTVLPGRYVLGSPIVVPGRVHLGFDYGAEITPGAPYLNGGTYAGAPLMAHYTARGTVVSATTTTLTTATYVDVATKSPFCHCTSPAIAGSANTQPLLGAWIYVDRGNAGTNILAGRITAMSTNALTATVNAWTNVTGAAGTPAASDRFWVGPDPANGNALNWSGLWQMRQSDKLHITGGRFIGDHGVHDCGGFYSVVTCQNIWLPGSATLYTTNESHPDSAHVIKGMKFNEFTREGMIISCGGSGTNFAYDNQANHFSDIQTWHCGVGGDYAGVWFGSVDSTLDDSEIASSGQSGSTTSCGVYLIGADIAMNNTYVWFTKGVGVVMASARQFINHLSINDSSTYALHMYSAAVTAHDIHVENSWNDQTTPASRPAIYQEGGLSQLSAWVTNRSTDGAATHPVRFGPSHGIISHVVGRNLPGGAVVESCGTTTQATGHTVVTSATTNTNVADVVYAVGFGLLETTAAYDQTFRIGGPATSPGGYPISTSTSLQQIDTDLVHPLLAGKTYLIEGFFYYWVAAADNLLMALTLSTAATGSYSIDYTAAFQRLSGTFVGPGAYFRYTAGAFTGQGVDSSGTAVGTVIQAIGAGTTFGGVNTRTISISGRAFTGATNCDIFPIFGFNADNSGVDGRILDGSWFRVKEIL